MTTLDARGLSCPLPVLKANKLMRQLEPGEKLTVLATDPASPKDFERYCEQTGHIWVECRDDGEGFTIIIRKATPTL